MTAISAKLAFVHRRLWQRDATYRMAIILGPPPLFGCLLAAALWGGVQAFEHSPADAGQSAPWAHRPPSPVVQNSGPPRAEAPMAGLPASRADGTFDGLVIGWQGEILPIEVSPTLNVDIVPKPLAAFTFDGPTIDMAPIMAAGPSAGLYIGVDNAIWAVKTAGTYALTLRFERSSEHPAECLTRMALAGHRLVSELNVHVGGVSLRNYDPVSFDLQPGLYRVGVAFGCWHDGRVVGPGQATVMIQHPGETAPQPARADEIFRPSPKPR